MSRVAELRKARGLTQRQLANMVGVDTSTVRNWETSRDGVKTFVRLAKLCDALSCNIDELFGPEEEPAQ